MQTSRAPICHASSRLLADFFEAQMVGVRLTRAATEGAELASDKTDIREINIAVDDVRDDVADEFGTQDIRRDQQSQQIVAIAVREGISLFE